MLEALKIDWVEKDYVSSINREYSREAIQILYKYDPKEQVAGVSLLFLTFQPSLEEDAPRKIEKHGM